jgi:exopolysaccharide biosynthesis predicted pyruvyltransferase EpsI
VTTRQLLPDEAFDGILSQMYGTKWLRVKWPGKYAGSDMITDAATMLFDRHGIETTNTLDEAGGIVFDGGANIGPPWSQKGVRKPLIDHAEKMGMKVVVLPQSANEPMDEPFPACVKLFARESTTAKMTGWEMAPDMAMCFQVDDDVPQGKGKILVLRGDAEKMTPMGFNDTLFDSVKSILEFCCVYEEIETDRLHLAIAGLLLGRKVSLRTTRYHKNKSMYDTWLSELGCHWVGT